jgi:hypothetical protein
MDPDTKLRDSHDVSQSLQRKLEGLADVERAFVHVDYDYSHDIHEEHRPVYAASEPDSSIRSLVKRFLFKNHEDGDGERDASVVLT